MRYSKRKKALLDFAFFEFNVFFRDGVVFPDHHFLRHRPRIFLGDVEKASIGR